MSESKKPTRRTVAKMRQTVGPFTEGQNVEWGAAWAAPFPGAHNLRIGGRDYDVTLTVTDKASGESVELTTGKDGNCYLNIYDAQDEGFDL